MSKLNINFNDNNYSIDESALAPASATLESHLSTVMNGTGAKINFSGNSYDIDSAKLSTATNSFVSHLGTIAGGEGGLKVVISGGEAPAFEPIVWDGNTEGRETFYEGNYVKIASYVSVTEPSQVERFIMKLFDENGDVAREDDFAGSQCVAIMEHGWAIADGAYVLASDGQLSMNGIDVPEGVWAAYFPAAGLGFSETITILPKTTITPPVEYSLDPTKLADAIAELEAVLAGLNSPAGSDTLTWDGNTEGLYVAMGALFKVSDIAPEIEYLTNSVRVKAIVRGQESEEEISEVQNMGVAYQVYSHGNGSVMIVPNDVEVEGVRLLKGTYFMQVGNTFCVTSVTIPGYTGF